MKKTWKVMVLGLFFVSLLWVPTSFGARDLVASMALLPGLVISADKGPYVDLVKAIDDVYPGNIKIEVYPAARSIQNVIGGLADFHIPSTRNPLVPETKLPFNLVSEKLGTAAFVIYSNNDKIITKKIIDDAVAKGGQFPYTIEVPATSKDNYQFPTDISVEVGQSLMKIQNKRTDAMVRPQDSTDVVLKQLKLNMIHREFYWNLDDEIVVQKSPKGEEVEKILSDCIKKLKASGRLQELYKKIHVPYVEWQPSQMGW